MVPTAESKSGLQAVAEEVFSVIGFDLILFLSIFAVVLLLHRLLRHVRRGDSERLVKEDVVKINESIGNVVRKDSRMDSSGSVARKEVRGASSIESLEPPQDLAKVVDLTVSTRMQAAKALAYYKEYSANKRHFRFNQELAAAGSKYTASGYYVALVQAAGRVGQPDIVLQCFDDMCQVGIERPLDLYESAMKLLAKRKAFKEAIEVYDRLARDALEPSPVMLSCLVGFSAEVGDLARAKGFYNKLCKHGPSVKACMTMMRLYAKQADWNSSVAFLREIRSTSLEVDTVLLNIVLATGVAAGEFEEVKELLKQESKIADVVSHNTVLKGLAQQGDFDAALQLLSHMKGSGVSPNLISFNTAIDAAVRGSRTDEAWRLFAELQKDYGLTPDKCTCSTLVKGFTKNTSPAQVTTILDLIDTVFVECTSQLRQTLLSGTLATSMRISHVDLAMRTFSKMCYYQIAPSAKETRVLLTMLAKGGHIAACTTVWASSLSSYEFQVAYAQVKYLMDLGYSIDRATLEVLPQFFGGSHKKAEVDMPAQLWNYYSAPGWDCW